MQDLTSELLKIEDPEFQVRLMKVPDLIVQAMLADADPPLREKILKNLPRARTQTIRSAEPVPDRTKIVARKVFARVMLGLEDPAAKPREPAPEIKLPTRKDYMFFIRKMHDRHPDFIEAREARRVMLTLEYVRRNVNA